MASDEAEGQGGGRGARLRAGLGLALIIALAAGLRLYRLDRNGTGSPYYAAAVRSMLESPTNFLFVAFDPVGFLALDKPPVAFWVQAAGAFAFGYRGLSLLVPQAILGLGSVALTSHLTARAFGAGAGRLAGLFLAITPIAVAVDRTNVPDPALVFVLLLAAWALLRAVETGRIGPLLLASAMVGVGYNVKMLAALLVVPAFILVAALTLPGGAWARVRGLAASSAVLAAVAMSWSLVVEATPASRRPYVGGSRNNSALELAFGYNGLERILWRSSRSWTSGVGTEPGEWAGFDGAPGPLRFAGPVMAGQITWLVPMALIGIVATAARLPGPRTVAAAWVLWTAWLGTHWAVFSLARGVLHEHYTAAMGPPVAALAGAGAVALRDEWRRGSWRALWLPMGLALTLAWQAFVLAHYPEWRRWLLPAMLGSAGLGLAGLIAARLGPTRASTLAQGLVLLSILIAPGAWSMIPVLAQGDNMMPLADPSILDATPAGMPRPGRPPFQLDPRGTRRLARFLEANRHGEAVAMASMETFLAAPLIIEAGLPAVALGGFSGTDRILGPGELAERVRRGWLRFVLLVPGQGRTNAEVITWIHRNGRPVDPALWRAEEADLSAESPGAPSPLALVRAATVLYDLRPEASPIVPAARR